MLEFEVPGITLINSETCYCNGIGGLLLQWNRGGARGLRNRVRG